MRILAVETSCDETSAAIVESDGTTVRLLSLSTATSLSLHSKTGGIIPEVAAREQSKYIIPVIQEALDLAKSKTDPKHHALSSMQIPDIDAIAVTYGPGLIGSLLVGVETAKTLSLVWNKPLIPVNHLFGHIYANWLIDNRSSVIGKNDNPYAIPDFPLVALIVSGGHTDLLLMKSHIDITWLGGTRDDAAGECFDKSGRLLGFPYPAGPEIEKRAKLGNPKAYHFPRPLLHDAAFDFSFSGLKTAILREVQQLRHPALDAGSMDSRLRGNDINDEQINNICRGLQDAISDVLVSKTIQAAEKYNVSTILLSGGVAANQTLCDSFVQVAKGKGIMFHVPPKYLCTDNAAMVGAAAIFRNEVVEVDIVTANPELYFD